MQIEEMNAMKEKHAFEIRKARTETMELAQSQYQTEKDKSKYNSHYFKSFWIMIKKKLKFINN
jgi:hypothetical protein